ncbi:MAG: GMP synthase (glutamine-hydrolyzing) [Kiritimatiellia bacterium]|jgi:GMP synthase (glutamine-hydrolysing)
MPRALLISLRDSHDAMARHEAQCFCTMARLEADELDVHFMVDGRPADELLEGYDAIFFGGSGAYSVLDDTEWIRATVPVMLRVIDRGLPAWASCFGFQGLALALGGRVVHDESRTEMGSTLLHLTAQGELDPLFGTLPTSFWAQEGHQDHVVDLPPGVTQLARGDGVHAQGFRVDGKPFWASQFHPELVLAATLERFFHYAEHYMDPSELDSRLQVLVGGQDTPQVGELLARLVRGHWHTP